MIIAPGTEKGRYFIFQELRSSFAPVESSVYVINHHFIINKNPELLEIDQQVKKKIIAFHKKTIHNDTTGSHR